MRRIAFFGGSFDPPHRGHLAIAKAAADDFALDEVLFAPVARQPLKDQGAATEFAHRYAMTALATESDPRFVPSLLDAPLQTPTDRPNYTADTLERLRSWLPTDTQLFSLLGTDAWLTIARWHDAPRLLSLADWIVAARPGFSLTNAAHALPPEVVAKEVPDRLGSLLELGHENGSTTRVFFLPAIEEEASATALRVALDAGDEDPDWLPAGVREYIRKTGLYRDNLVSGRIR